MSKRIYTIISKKDVSKQVSNLLSSQDFTVNYNKSFVIFDISDVVLVDNNNSINKDIYCAIKYSIKNNNNVIFLSYDNSVINNMLLNKITLFKSIPIIQIKLNHKLYLLEEIYKLLNLFKSYKKKMILVENVNSNKKRINKSYVKQFHYLMNTNSKTNSKSNNSDSDSNKDSYNENEKYLKNKKSLYKLLKVKLPKKTKKQLKYNQILQNNIRKNVKLFNLGKYKSKKQAIAIAYQETNNGNISIC